MSNTSDNIQMLHNSVKQLISRQNQLLQHSAVRQSQQQQQLGHLTQTLSQSMQTLGKASATQNRAHFDTTDLARVSAKRAARSWDKAMSKVIIDLSKQWQRFGRDGEINIGRLGQSLWKLIQTLQHQGQRSIALSHSAGFPQTMSGLIHQGIGTVLGGIFHQGGKVDATTTQLPLPAALFRHAPRLHQGGRIALGIGAAEYPAILQRGETVLPAKAQSPTQSTQAPAKIEVNIHQAPSAAKVTQHQRADGQIQIDVIFEQWENQLSQRLRRGDGLAGVIENRYSLNPVAHR